MQAGADFINSSTVNPEGTVTYAPPSGVFSELCSILVWGKSYKELYKEKADLF